MMKERGVRRAKKGFTLIEVLVVIVILVILASLILPRMMTQPERALVAEAVNYLGVIRRAQESIVGPTQGNWIAANSTAGWAGNEGWQGLGLGPIPSDGSSSFSYTCTAGAYDDGSSISTANMPGTCTAKRANTNPWGNKKAGGTITVLLKTGTITACGAPYVMIGDYGAPGTTCA